MIKIYKVSDYKKDGTLKKSAKGLFFNNTDEHGKDDRYERLAGLIKQDGFNSFSKPYVFTSIHALHDVHGEVRIRQEIQGFTVSPDKLFEALKLNI